MRRSIQASVRTLGPRAWVVCLAAAGLAGCGGADRDQTASPTPRVEARGAPAQAAVESYFRAVDDADGGAICAHFTERLRQAIARLQGVACQRALAAEARRLPGSLNAYRIRAVEVDGPTAEVLLGGGTFRDRMRLVRRGRHWKISSAPGLGR